MELIKPDFGLIFWMTLAFAIVFFVLAKFAFPLINRMLGEREKTISDALENARLTEEKMKNYQVEGEKLTRKAQQEHDEIIADARRSRDRFIEESKAKAAEESSRIIEAAKESAKNERMAAQTDIKNQIATISIEMAEKILKRELSNPEAQKEYIEKLLEDFK